ncbi:hypothetical protein CLV60_1336 [Dyadobacter jiangsuensis]|uniref:Uncharacterized protein n=1 Tax=Dyadobacter jiangsuensis TaxID=1591085 RepID=A0A2P8F8N5_9BACT|nr:hypothetical protein CLV60_1336 [Dyadobacter jiangsuensis]
MIARFTLILIACFLNFQCKDPDKQPNPCDCQSKAGKEQKNVEAVVIRINFTNPAYGTTGPDEYILSIDPREFNDSTFAGGPNILVPCDSLPAQYRKPRTNVIISYKRKDCYGALTTPASRTSFGYYIDLTSIWVKTP